MPYGSINLHRKGRWTMDLVTQAATLIGYVMIAALLLWALFEATLFLRRLATARHELQGKIALLEVDNRNLQARCRALNALSEELLTRDRELSKFVRRLADQGFREDLDQDCPDTEALARLDAQCRTRARQCLDRARSSRGGQGTLLTPVVDRLTAEAEQLLAASPAALAPGAAPPAPALDDQTGA
jgi:hypothetical protein